tara:strand:+ start:409 stop:3432 length:3024 start_codon:yes stop_codon:yes gene_type:complete
MAKQTYVIKNFHGGLNSNADPRDIAQEEASDIKAGITNLGKLTTLGQFDTGTTTGSNTTGDIVNKYGLFVMSSDTKIDNSAGSETLIFLYDQGTNIDVLDSSGWNASEITVAGSSKPVFFSADGILRVGDKNLNSLGRWYGYINRTAFSSLGSSEAINDWIDTNAYPATPSAGNCLISTPNKASDSTGPNSNIAQYIGAIGSGLIDNNAVNLRVGVAGVTSVKTDGTAINASHDSAKVPNESANLMDDYRKYTGGSSGAYANAEDVYPLFLNNNIIMGGKESHDAFNGASNEIKDDGSVANLNYTINDKKSVAVGVYFWQEELDRVNVVTIKLGGDSSNYREWQVPVSKLAVGWNILVCEQGLQTSETGAPPAYGDSHDYYSITVTQINATNGNANTDVPKFYISGPVLIENAGSIGYTEGTYSFYYTWLFDDEKQESMPFKFQDTDSSDSYAKELNQVTIVGSTLLLNFDIYINAKPSGTYGLNKRIIGSRVYYKKTDDDNYYLIGESNFIDKGFKFFPEAETYDYSFIDVTDTTTNLANAVAVTGITPERANVVDTWKSLNGFYQKVDTLQASWKTGTVQGRRAYVGNVKQDNVTYPDRMLKSMVNRFDTFPNKDSIVDVAVRDGENIVKLESFADRILQFKEKTLYVINVAQGSEFLENIYPYNGIANEYHSIKTDKGIAFFNEYGAYLFTGNQVVNLLEKNGRTVISEDTWRTFITDSGIEDSSIGYAPKKHQIVFLNYSGIIYVYNLKLGSWIFTGNALSTYRDYDARKITRLAVDGDNNMFFIGGTNSTVYKYSHLPSTTHDFTYITKDIDFGDPSIRKKIYKVYITYRTAANELPNIVCTFDVNGETAYDKTFKDGTNYSTFLSDYKSLLPSANWTTAVLKPTTSSEANNIYSFALKLNINSNVRSNTAQGADDATHITLDSGASSVDDYYNNMQITIWSGNGLGETTRIHDYVGSSKVATVTPAWSTTPNSSSKFIIGLVPSSFEINDITIVYRAKSVK